MKIKHSLLLASLAANSLLMNATAHEATHVPTKATKTKQGARNQMPESYKLGVLRTSSANMDIRMFYEFGSFGVDSAGMLTLKVMRVGSGESATIELVPDAAVTMVAGLPSKQASFNTGDQYTIKIKPTTDGLHYINVFLKSGQSTEAMAIPVQIGKNANLNMSKTDSAKAMPNGRSVISIQAQ